jgi:hypothetical protein
MAVIRSRPSERIINGNVIRSSENAIVSDTQFRTRGEFLIIVKSVSSCTITLDHSTTDHVIVKALTNVLILPSIGLIDEEFEEVSINKGACVEFIFASGNWYIVSSDGLKTDQ